MIRLRAFIASTVVFSALVCAPGCPHRSPLWSPDGKSVIVLAGAKGEKVDSPATQLWLVDVTSATKRRLPGPEPGARFLSATWLDSKEFVVATGLWDGEYVTEGSEKLWRRSVAGTAWKRIEAPAPSGARTTRRLPVAIGDAAPGGTPGKDGAAPGKALRTLVYPSGGEKVIAVSLETGRALLALEPAELVGPGPAGGFLAYRENESGVTELVAVGGDLKERWKTKFSELRAGIARKLGRKPVEVVFNELSTSHLPFGRGAADWVGVTLIYAAPGWEDGIPGFYARVASSDGRLLDVARARGLWGQPASVGGLAWCVTAPVPKEKTPPALRAFHLEKEKPAATMSLAPYEKEQLHGYAVSPDGKHIAISVNGAAPELVIYPLRTPAEIGAPTKIVLK